MSIYYWLIIVTLATPTWSEHTRVKSIECHSFDPENIHIRSCILKPVGRGVKDVYVVIKLPKEPVTNATVDDYKYYIYHIGEDYRQAVYFIGSSGVEASRL